MAKEVPAFWVTNMCNRNVTLADLAVTIPAFRSVNLLDSKHYKYTLDQLQKSQKNGSLFAKRALIAVRQIAPTVIKDDTPLLVETYIHTRERSILEIKEQHYEELDVSDADQKKQEEEFAKDNADFAQMDEIKL
jgi:hypothetical protein